MAIRVSRFTASERRKFRKATGYSPRQPQKALLRIRRRNKERNALRTPKRFWW